MHNVQFVAHHTVHCRGLWHRKFKEILPSSMAKESNGHYMQISDLHIFHQWLLVCPSCCLPTSRAPTCLQKNCLVYMRFRCRNMESLHSDMPTCIKTYWIIHVNRRGLTGCALQIELRLKARNKQVKQINPKGQKKSCLDTISLKVAVK